MDNTIKKVQTDITWEVCFEGKEYTVVQIENLEDFYTQFDIFNEDGIIDDEELELEIATWVTENQ
jgi:hypothetical protein